MQSWLERKDTWCTAENEEKGLGVIFRLQAKFLDLQPLSKRSLFFLTRMFLGSAENV